MALREPYTAGTNGWPPSKRAVRYLGFTDSPPSLQYMRSVAQEALARLEFPPCTQIELYWLCCVFTDYWTQGGFIFEKLVLPDWFPLPFGFVDEEYIDKKLLDLKGRIRPPFVWDENDRIFWFEREPLSRLLRPELREKHFKTYPENRDFVLLLPDKHPVRKYFRRGRPNKTKANGETMLE